MKVIAKVICGCVLSLGAMHTAEWFLVGRKVAAAADIPVTKALPQCLLRGFLWWKPLKKELEL